MPFIPSIWLIPSHPPNPEPVSSSVETSFEVDDVGRIFGDASTPQFAHREVYHHDHTAACDDGNKYTEGVNIPI